MASKIKKLLKKVGKAALVAGAGYAAMKGLKNRKENKAFLKTEGGDRSDMRDYGPFTKSARTMPTTTTRRDSILGKPGINRFDDGNMYQPAKNGGRIGKKSGGKALRGYGKAMKGKR
jgi:hypothetical protein